MAMDAGPLAFVSYHSIRDITLKKTFWTGWQLSLTLDSGVLPLTALGVLKQAEKQEILEKVKQSIKGKIEEQATDFSCLPILAPELGHEPGERYLRVTKA